MSETLCIYFLALLAFDMTFHIVSGIMGIVDNAKLMKSIGKGQLKIKQVE